MNKIAIIFIPIIFALHFLMAPQNLIPNGWIEDIQQGKKVAQLFITFYRAQSATATSNDRQPEAEVAHPPRPLAHNEIIAIADLRPADQTLKECDMALKKMESQIKLEIRRSMRIVLIKNEVVFAVARSHAALGPSGLRHLPSF